MRFPGQYFDAETGTHYNYFRDYDASTGRYIQSDPIGVTFRSVRRSKGRARVNYQLNNLYGYAFGNSVRYIDPLGLAPNQMCVAACSIGGGLIGGALGQAAGGAIGGLLGGAAGTAVAPGVGTVGGAAAGALAGGRFGGAAGAAGGTAVGNAFGQAICSEDKEEECHETYVLDTKNCDAYKKIFGDRWWQQCYKEAFGDYQRCRGYSSPD
jgi:RHS repeat-associated protein